MYVRFFASAVLLALVKLATMVLAPLLALCIVRRPDPDHQHPHTTEPHEAEHDWLWPWLRWAQTHDAPVDEWWYGGYGIGTWAERYTQADYERRAWLRYVTRVLWLWRNPAYTAAHWLGYDQRGMQVVKHRDEGHLWDSGQPNASYWTAVNGRGQRAFMLQRQWYWWRGRCLEIYLGWKLARRDPDERCMLVIRVSPFRRY